MHPKWACDEHVIKACGHTTRGKYAIISCSWNRGTLSLISNSFSNSKPMPLNPAIYNIAACARCYTDVVHTADS